MYKLEPAIAIGGEVVIYAQHLDVVSHIHEKYIYEVGYHILPYFLNDWERFKNIPLGVLAHSTHLCGSGVIENGIEKPNVHVTLASKISAEDCARLNLGYLDPSKINIAVCTWQLSGLRCCTSISIRFCRRQRQYLSGRYQGFQPHRGYRVDGHAGCAWTKEFVCLDDG